MTSTFYSRSIVPTIFSHPLLNQSPIHLDLLGPNSSCYLKPFNAPIIKETLAKIAASFEPSQIIPLFNVKFTPNPENETSGELNQLMLNVFGFINEVVRCASNYKFQFDFSDFVGFFVENIQDTTLSTRRAYAVTIVLSEKAVNVSAKAGLVFSEMSLIKL